MHYIRHSLSLLLFCVSPLALGAVTASQSEVSAGVSVAIFDGSDEDVQTASQSLSIDPLNLDVSAAVTVGTDTVEMLASINATWSDTSSGVVIYSSGRTISLTSTNVPANFGRAPTIWRYTFETDAPATVSLLAALLSGAGFSNTVRLDGIGLVNMDQVNDAFEFNVTAGVHTLEVEEGGIGFGGTFGPGFNQIVDESHSLTWTIVEDEVVFALDQMFDSPLPGFGWPVSLVGNAALIGAPNSSGSAALLDTQSGLVNRTFDNPNPDFGDFYARNVDLSAGRVLITSPAEDLAASDSGAAYLFEAVTGNLLQTITHPAPAPGQSFGRGGVLNGDHALIGTFGGGAFLFDVVTGDVLHTFPGLTPNPESLALSTQLVVIGDVTSTAGGQASSAGAVELFDTSTGNPLRTIFNPTPSNFDFFGEAVAIDGNRVLIGAGQVDTGGLLESGEAYLFDSDTGQLLQTFNDPTPSAGALFGRALDIEGDLLAIAAEGNNEVHIFDAVSGAFLQTLTEQPAFGFFGRSVDLDAGRLLVGAPDGGAYLYLMPGPANEAPIAEAGDNKSIHAGELVALDGSGSSDDLTATGDLVYSWTFVTVPPGSNTVLAGDTTITPSFIADLPGDYVVSLIVTDESGLSSAPDTVTASSLNTPPTADAGVDQGTIVGNPVLLDGSGSSDADLDAISYAWTLADRPPNSAASLTGADSISPVLVPDLIGIYSAELVVNDGFADSTPDDIVVTVITPESFAEMNVTQAINIIALLPPSSVRTEGNRRSLSRRLSKAVAALQSGKIAKASRKLRKAIERTDGCALRGVPDSRATPRPRPKKDYITECASQGLVYPLLNEALASLVL